MHPPTASIRLRALIASAIFGCLCLEPCAGAAASPDDASRTVRFADLDPTAASSAHVLYRRIHAAAQVVCSHYFFATDAARVRCVRDATADAVARLNLPPLSAVYEAHNEVPATRR